MEELQTRILNEDLDDLLGELLFEEDPFIFREDRVLLRRWKKKLSELLEVDQQEILITGSAAVGYSLSPHKPLRPFGGSSDIDIAVVSDSHFSQAWYALRRMDISSPKLSRSQRGAIQEHSRRFVYWGCIATDRVLPLLPFATRWMAAKAAMSGEPPTEEREINFRVYKDYRALREYQLQGLANLRVALLEDRSCSPPANLSVEMKNLPILGAIG